MNENKKNIGGQRFRRNLVNRHTVIRNRVEENQPKKNDEQVNSEQKILEGSPMNTYYRLHSEKEDNSDKYNIKVGFLIIATGKYDIFVKPLIDSIEKYVLNNNKKHYNIFSDKEILLPDYINYTIHKIEHKPFPHPTLKRFHFFDQYKNQVIGDQLVYIDADTLIKDTIGTEILNPVTVTQHCGFVNRVGSFERRTESKSYINPLQYKNYFGGGFYSFSRDEFFKMCRYCKNIIDMDESAGIIPIWHDESALNKYMTTIEPSRVLSPSYHFPEENESIYRTWGGKDRFPCKILLLNKNHKEIRS